jgi:hypothetical protein
MKPARDTFIGILKKRSVARSRQLYVTLNLQTRNKPPSGKARKTDNQQHGGQCRNAEGLTHKKSQKFEETHKARPLIRRGSFPFLRGVD